MFAHKASQDWGFFEKNLCICGKLQLNQCCLKLKWKEVATPQTKTEFMCLEYCKILDKLWKYWKKMLGKVRRKHQMERG